MTDEPSPRRTRAKFTLPEHDLDETPTAMFEALVYGPPAPKSTRRPRKFSLPEHHHEERVGDRIEAFLDGPPARRRRPPRRAKRRPIEFGSPADLQAELRREATRQARYGRPMAVLAMAVLTDRFVLGAADAADRRLREIVGREVRETDRAARVAVGRLQVMLPETGEEEAANLATRIERAFRAPTEDGVGQGDLHLEIIIPRRGMDPLEALADGERRLEEATGQHPTSSTA